MPAAKKGLSRTMRQAREYATRENTERLPTRRMEQMAPSAKGAPAPAKKADQGSSFAEVMCKELKDGVKNAGIRSLSRMQATVAGTIAGIQGASKKNQVRIISTKATDRELGVALGVTQVALTEATPQSSMHFLVVCPADSSVVSLQRQMASLTASDSGAFITLALEESKGAAFTMPSAKDTRRGCVAVLTTPAALAAMPKTAIINKMKFHAVVLNDVAIPTETLAQVTTEKTFALGSAEQVDQAVPAAAAEENAENAGPAKVVQYTTCTGLHRFQLLYSLVANSGKSQRIVVNFSTRQTASFYIDLLFALKIDVNLLTDAETGDAEESNGVSPTMDEFEQAKPGEGIVLFTAFGRRPRNADVFVQFDPICVPLVQFARQLIDLGSDSGADAAATGSKRKRDAGDNGNANAYAHVIIFLYPNELRSCVPILKAAGKGRLDMQKLEVSNTVRHLVTLHKVTRLIKKLFLLNNKAYEAYRSLMMVYSHLSPKSVFDVRALELDEVAQQFGLETAPLLDLRTKENEFRPKEDVKKAAEARLRKDRRALREAAALIEPEPTEEHIPDTPAADEE